MREFKLFETFAVFITVWGGIGPYKSVFALRKEEASVCVACNTVLTIKHILIECDDLLEVRRKYFEQKSLYSLFRNVSPEIIFDFLREIDVFYKI